MTIDELIQQYQENGSDTVDMDMVEEFLTSQAVGDEWTDLPFDERESLAYDLGFHSEEVSNVYDLVRDLSNRYDVSKSELTCLLECISDSQGLMRHQEMVDHVYRFFSEICDIPVQSITRS